MFGLKPPHPGKMPAPPRKPMPSAIVTYSGPELWEEVVALGRFYRGRAYISTTGRVYHWTERRGWHVVRPHTSKRNGKTLVRLTGPDGKKRDHYPSTLLEGAFLHRSREEEPRRQPLSYRLRSV